MNLYWINSTLAATPALLWMFVGVGLPWALVALPRQDWRQRALVAALSLAFGPALITAWMFVLGSVPDAALLRTELILAGSGLIAIIGWGFASRKRASSFQSSVASDAPNPVRPEEWLLIVLIAVALAVRWLNVAYWPHMAYDEMWVYGYEGRLYTLVGNIPQHIGYYPQFLPLQFSYLQILTVDGFNDHVARAVLPYLQLGSILAVYVLGARLFNRRAGLFATAIWTFYPHVGEWSRFGDLEIPLTFLFTLSAAFFLMAWLGEQPRKRYALLAGLTFGIALWTKPTAGAFAWGVMLLTAFELLRLRFDWRAWLPRFQVALITGLACMPLGGIWYVRNILLGLDPLVLPEGFWLTQAARSGIEFGFPLLALSLLLLYVLFHLSTWRSHLIYLRNIFPGALLVLAGLVPSMIGHYRMGALDFALLFVGCAALWWVLRPYFATTPMLIWHETKLIHVNLNISQGDGTGLTAIDISRFGWMYLLALPYFITWFYSYSYHYRLSFAIVPLMLMPAAVILARWLSAPRVYGAVRRLAFAVAVIAVAHWGIIIPLYDINAGWMWDYDLPDDFARYTSGNWALMRIVYALQEYKDVFDVTLSVSAPGMQRLAFFFPLDNVYIDSAPTYLEDLSAMTHYVYSFEAERMYSNVDSLENEVASARAVHNVMLSSSTLADNDFLYELYAVDLAARFRTPAPITPECVPTSEVVIGGFASFYGCYAPSTTLQVDTPLPITFYWYTINPTDEDYFVSVQLYDAADTLLIDSTMPVARADGRYYYSTLFWDTGEYVQDMQTLTVGADAPTGEDYRVVIGMVRASDGVRLPVIIGGVAGGGDSYTLDMRFQVVR